MATQKNKGPDVRAGRHESDELKAEYSGGYGQIEQEPARGRKIGTKRERRPDAEVRKDVYARLQNSDELDLSQAEVLVSDGIVVLLGSVPDHATKRQIEDACETVPGVFEIHDQLLVSTVNADADPGGFRMEAPRAGFRGPGS
jgi:hypothetical protein